MSVENKWRAQEHVFQPFSKRDFRWNNDTHADNEHIKSIYQVYFPTNND